MKRRANSRDILFARNAQKQRVEKTREMLEHENRLAAAHEQSLQQAIDARKQIVGEGTPEPLPPPRVADALKDSSLVNTQTGLTYRHEHYLALLMEWGLARSIISACVYSGTATPLMLMGLADSVKATLAGERDPRIMLTEREAASAILRILNTRDVRIAIAKHSAAVVGDAGPRKEKADVMRELWALRETIRAQYRLEEGEALKQHGLVEGVDGGGPVGRA